MKVLGLDHYGKGIIKVDGKTGFISNALKDEEIEYIVSREKSKFFEGEAVKIDKKNSDRVEVLCKYFKDCGGCNLLHMNYAAQKEFKCDKVKNILERFGKIKVENLEIVTGEEFNYRNKVVLHVKNGGLGFYRENSNDLISIEQCLIASNKINDLIGYLKNNIEGITKIIIKIGNITEEVMLILDGKNIDKNKYLDLVDVLVINKKIVSQKDTIISIIGSKKYLVSPNSFFQVNTYLTEKLYDEVRNNIKVLSSKNVLDLYCGTGTIGIYISDQVENVLGVEIVESSYLNALDNKKLNEVENIVFTLGDVKDKIKEIKSKYDTVIVDPPRSGLDRSVIERIKEINPKNIIYISCDPITLSRDLKYLKDIYDIAKINLFDMFPNTYHVECVCVLNRR